MNPCYWAPIEREIQPHGVDYGPDRYIVTSVHEQASEPLHKRAGLVPVVVTDEIEEIEEITNKAPEIRPPKPPFGTHGHVMWTTLNYKRAVYVGFVKAVKKKGQKFGSRQVSNIRHGPGTMTYNSTDTCQREYRGDFWEDNKHGKGNEKREDGLATFVGKFRNGKRHGRGVIKYQTGEMDKGIWNKGSKAKTIMRGLTGGVKYDT